MRSSEGLTPMEWPLVQIVVLTWNDWKGTLRNLERVFRSDYLNYRVIVVDNGSKDGSIERFKEWAEGKLLVDESGEASQLPTASPVPKPLPYVEYEKPTPEARVPPSTVNPPLTLIQTGDNLGYAGGNNVGIAHALENGAEYVLLLNNDALVAPDTVRTLVETAREGNATMVGARVQDEMGTCELFSGAVWPGQLFGRAPSTDGRGEHAYWDSSYADGCSLLLHRELLSARYAEGGYYIDPAYFIYYEEQDLCLYGGAQGGRCLIARDAFVYHGLAKSMGGRLNPRGIYYQTRNRIYLAKRWLNLPWKVLFHVYFIPSRVALLSMSRSRWRRDVLRAVSAGVIDGYTGRMGRWKYH